VVLVFGAIARARAHNVSSWSKNGVSWSRFDFFATREVVDLAALPETLDELGIFDEFGLGTPGARNLGIDVIIGNVPPFVIVDRLHLLEGLGFYVFGNRGVSELHDLDLKYRQRLHLLEGCKLGL
jgi:hypothetical protein